MIGLKKKLLNVNGVVFEILADDLNAVEEYFKESVINCGDDVIANISIELYVDYEHFMKKRKNFNMDSARVYDTFLNQKHFQDGNLFLIDNEDYICEKINEHSYKIYAVSKNPCKSLLRVIRELIIREMEDFGYFFMHGVGLMVDGNGILILGNSGSGKTTLMTKINSLDVSQYLVSNDRVFLRNDEMRYFPLPIVYSMGTVKNNEKLNEYFERTNWLKKRRGLKYISYKQKCDVPLLDIKKIFNNVGNVSSGKVSLIIFPRIGNKCQIHLMKKEEKLKKLNECNFTPNDTESLRSEWIKFRNTPKETLEENKKKFHNFLIDNVRIIELEYSYDTPKEEILNVLVNYDKCCK